MICFIILLLITKLNICIPLTRTKMIDGKINYIVHEETDTKKMIYFSLLILAVDYNFLYMYMYTF